ncbi:FecR domain-containing protein [Pedobacter sp. P351]|uniref:FecR family protein n=1 Tax=Pedobacter superstes TaxID=3133441 RepID=UPI0030973C67
MISQDRFIELVTKEFIDELTVTEGNELKLLLDASEVKERYDLLKQYLSNDTSNLSSHSDSALFERVKRGISKFQESAPGQRVITRKAFWIAGSIAAIFILGFITFFLQTPSHTHSTHVVSTNRATKKTIILSDGTKVILNAASKLLYPELFEGETREVRLIGEGFFDVVKDSKRPFIVHTDKTRVRVLGTAFNVKSYPEDRFSETTLIRGTVEVTLKDRPADKVTLRPSEKLIVKYLSKADKNNLTKTDNALTEVTHIQKSDTTVIETSWMYNKIAFKDETLEHISNILERTFDVEVQFNNEKLKALKFTGTFERESVRGILVALSTVEPFEYKIRGNNIIIQ